MTTFADIPDGTVFQVKPGQGCTAFGRWKKRTADWEMFNAHRPDNENHRAFIGRNLKVIVLEGANEKG
jgi:hypothetical protein